MLREFERRDLDAVQRYASDPDVVRYLPWGPNTAAATRAFLQRAFVRRRERRRRDWDLAIVTKGDGGVVGGCGLYVSSLEHREGSIGYCLARAAWGHGYATETARGLLRFGFTDLRLHRIFATCDPRNVASVHVLEKIGMRREGHLREHRWEKQEWRDSLVYALLEHEHRDAA